MNTLLIVGLVLCGVGALGWIVSTAMISHYDQKLEALDRKLRKDDKWRNGSTKEQIPFQDNQNF